MTGAGEIDHIYVVILDEAVEMHINHTQAWRRTPVAQKARLDMFGFQGFTQERILL